MSSPSSTYHMVWLTSLRKQGFISLSFTTLHEPFDLLWDRECGVNYMPTSHGLCLINNLCFTGKVVLMDIWYIWYTFLFRLGFIFWMISLYKVLVIIISSSSSSSSNISSSSSSSNSSSSCSSSSSSITFVVRNCTI